MALYASHTHVTVQGGMHINTGRQDVPWYSGTLNPDTLGPFLGSVVIGLGTCIAQTQYLGLCNFFSFQSVLIEGLPASYPGFMHALRPTEN